MDWDKDWLANAHEGMSRRQFLARVTAAGAAVAGYAPTSQAVAGEIISTPTAGLTVVEGKVNAAGFAVPVYLARPARGGQYPVVIVLPEVFGMHAYIKDVVRRFAARGFLAATFEPYAREGGVLHLTEMGDLRKVVDAVPDARVMADLDALVAYVKKDADARPDCIGVTGFCRGGMYALLYAAHNPEVKAVVSWYGQIKPPKPAGIRSAGPLDIAARIKAPVLGLYGAEDLGIPVADIQEMESALQSAGTTAEFVIYPNAPHAFHADYRPSYRENAAKDGWARCLAWFTQYLKS